MHSKVGGDGSQAQETAPQERQDTSSQGSGQGSATALARLRKQQERLAREQPADDPTHPGRRHAPRG